MTSQPADSTPNISPTAVILLAVSVLAGTILAGLIAAQAVTGIKVYVGAAGFLGGIMSVGGLGFIIQLAAERIMRRLDHLDEQVAAQRVAYLPAPAALDDDALRERVERMAVEELGTRESVRAAGYAEGYVDGIDRRGGEPSVN